MVINSALFYHEDGTMDTKESIYTLILEYAHILSLGVSQVQLVDPNIDDATRERLESKCQTYFLTEWCLKSNSYLKNFIDQFRTTKMLEKVWYEEWDVYKRNKKDFVSEYAASNPGEDIAESFTAFVLKSKPANEKTKADQKVLFFYRYPELTKLRSTIRSRLP